MLPQSKVAYCNILPIVPPFPPRKLLNLCDQCVCSPAHRFRTRLPFECPIRPTTGWKVYYVARKFQIMTLSRSRHLDECGRSYPLRKFDAAIRSGPHPHMNETSRMALLCAKCCYVLSISPVPCTVCLRADRFHSISLPCQSGKHHAQQRRPPTYTN